MNIKDSDLLLVIDMQNVYKKGMDWSCDGFDEAVRNIQRLIKFFPSENIAFTKFVAPENPVGIWQGYNLENQSINESEFLNDITDELMPFINETNMYSKSTYSSLKNEQLLKRIDKADRVFVTGVVAECCVLSTVFELIDYGKKVIYVTDGVAGENADKEEAVRLSLEGLSPLHIEFIDTDRVVR